MVLRISDRIKINKGKLCVIIRYIGKVTNKEGLWVGLELEDPKGTNNGTVNGETYFVCKPNHGMFIKYKNLDGTLIKEEKDVLQYEDSIKKSALNNLNEITFQATKDNHILNTSIKHHNNVDQFKDVKENYNRILNTTQKTNISLFDSKNEEHLKKEIEGYKELINVILLKTTDSFKLIEQSLETLKSRISRIQKSGYNKKTESERERVVYLVCKILEGLDQNESIETYYIEYKRMLEKYNINIDNY